MDAKGENELLIALVSAILALLALPPAQGLVCRLSGFLCPPIDARDVTMRFFFANPSNRDYEPNESQRSYGNKFMLSQGGSIYFWLSFWHRSVRIFSDFSVHPFCGYTKPNSQVIVQLPCTIHAYQGSDGLKNMNQLSPGQNVYQRTGLLEFSNQGDGERPGRYQIILMIGGEGEAIKPLEIEREYEIVNIADDVSPLERFLPR